MVNHLHNMLKALGLVGAIRPAARPDNRVRPGIESLDDRLLLSTSPFRPIANGLSNLASPAGWQQIRTALPPQPVTSIPDFTAKSITFGSLGTLRIMSEDSAGIFSASGTFDGAQVQVYGSITLGSNGATIVFSGGWVTPTGLTNDIGLSIVQVHNVNYCGSLWYSPASGFTTNGTLAETTEYDYQDEDLFSYIVGTRTETDTPFTGLAIR
jgi:hypothetical protein